VAGYTCGDGRVVPVEIELSDAVVAGAPHALVGVVTDLSRKRRLEQQHVASGRMAAVGELAAGVAHEVNNPLFAILGLTEFLAKDAQPGSKAAERLELIKQSGNEIKDIVRALLEFARENAEEREIVPLAHVVRQAVTLMRRTNAHKGIELVPSYDGSDVLVRASANQLKQILLNLMTNARQAMPDGGTVWIEVRRDGQSALVTVADDGPGVPPADADRIFEPFFTTKGTPLGTGLGLSSSLGIAESHGGSLTLDTDRPRGAAFTLRLPAVEEGDE
jgi:two-component system NtrC family sensor kinase